MDKELAEGKTKEELLDYIQYLEKKIKRLERTVNYTEYAKYLEGEVERLTCDIARNRGIYWAGMDVSSVHLGT